MLEKVDALMGSLMDGLLQQRMDHCVNLIVLADHGMSDQSCSQTVFALNYSQEIADMLMMWGTNGNVFPQLIEGKSGIVSERTDAIDIDKFVSSLACRHPMMNVFTKTTLPKRHHFTKSQRIGDVLLDMRDEWLVFKNRLGFCTGGNHGWDDINKNMHALFLAHGPAFKENFTADPFENIELYNMMCDVLDITPSPNNGTAGSLNSMLNTTKPTAEVPLFQYTNCTYSGEDVPTCNCATTSPVPANDLFRDENEEILIWGHPIITNNQSVCLLHQNGFSMGYSAPMMSPVWITTLVNQNQKTSGWYTNSSCYLQDTRVQTECPRALVNENLTLTPVGPGFIVNEDVPSLSSSLVPMYNGFKNGLWRSFLDLLDDYLLIYGNSSVTVGPVYDYNNDGLWEGITNQTKFADSENTVPIPTHIYAIIIKCKEQERQLPCSGDVDILSFILPHLQTAPNCLTMDMYFRDNVARIRDIELLTSLRFMTAFDDEVAVKFRTYLPENIWPSGLFPRWEELPCPHQDLCKSDYKPLLLVSLDGFRADYLIHNFTPTIARLSQCGVHAPFMRSVFPTKSFPNHYSIVTGLYPESHGLVHNNMYDVTMQERFSYDSEAFFDPRWWGGEPIWITAKKQGLKTATYFWHGSDVNISGVYPDIWKRYDRSVTYSGRVQEVLSWLLLPANKRPDFATLYFDEPDYSGHKYGPSDIAGMRASLERVDATVNELMTGLTRFGLHHCVNLVILADHGMADVSCNRIVRLRNLVDYDYLSSNFWVWDGPSGRISNTYIYNPGSSNSISPAETPEPIEELLKNLTCASPHLNTYTKSTIPVRYHYSNNQRIDNILLDMEAEWLVTRNLISSCSGGNHGYDNTYRSMEALFLAYGPAFKWNYTIEPFENIELYNLFTDIINITAAPNNGTAGSMNHILQHAGEFPMREPGFPYINAYVGYKLHGDFADLEMIYCNGSCNANTKLGEIYNASSRPRHGSISLPFGLPAMTSQSFESRNISGLYERHFVTGFDIDNRRQMWTSRTFDQAASNSTDVKAFVRLSSIQMLSQAEETVALTSVLDAVGDVLMELLQIQKQVNMFGGYAYDYNHDSLPDKNISLETAPSHFYTFFTSCKDAGPTLDTCADFQTKAYIIPRQDGNQQCKAPGDYLTDVEARIRDVEILSGLEFFTSLPFDQAVRIRTFLPQRS